MSSKPPMLTVTEEAVDAFNGSQHISERRQSLVSFKSRSSEKYKRELMGSGSVFIPDQTAASYNIRNIDGTALLPRSPRRKMELGGKSKPSLPVSQELQEEEKVEEENIAVDPTHVDPYLQSLASTRFHFNRFLWELLVHMFMPLSLVLAVTAKGRVYLSNRSIIGLGDFVFYVQWAIYIMLAAIHVLFIWDKPPAFPLYELILLDLLFVIRHSVIATKYAFVSSLEYRDMSENIEPPRLRSERQVIAGWANPSLLSSDTQILLASVRQRVDLTLANFYQLVEKHTEKELANVQHNAVAADLQGKYASQDGSVKASAVLEKEESTSPLRSVVSAKKYSAWDVAKSFILESHSISYNGRLVFGFTFLHCFGPPIFRALEGHPFAGGTSASAYVIFVFSLLVGFFLMISNFAFILIAIMDVQRREFLQRRLNAFLLDGYAVDPEAVFKNHTKKEDKDMQDDETTEKLIRFDMTRPENIIAWWYLKVVMQDYGLQFYKRINTYSGLFLLFSLAWVVLLGYQALFGNGQVESQVIFLGILHVTVVLSNLIRLVYYAEELNSIRKTHAATAMHRRLDIDAITVVHEDRTINGKKGKEIAAYLKQSREIYATISEAIRIDNELFTVKLLGLRATSDLRQIASAILAAGVAAGVKILFDILT